GVLPSRPSMRAGASLRRLRVRWVVRLGAARDCRDDAYLVAGLEDAFEAQEEAHVFAIDVDVDEAPDFAVVFADARLEAGIGVLEAVDNRRKRFAIRRDDIEVIGEGTQGSRDSNLYRHCFSFAS